MYFSNEISLLISVEEKITREMCWSIWWSIFSRFRNIKK